MTKKTQNIILVSVGIVTILGLSFVFLRKKRPSSILLLGGLDYRSGDLTIDKQVELVNKGSGLETKGFRYSNSKDLIEEINKSKKPMNIVLFSKGGEYSREIAKAMKSKNIPLKYLHIVEPYAKSSITANSVKDSVKLGVPNANIMVGKKLSVGFGVVENATLTPSCSPYHWCALEEVGKAIKSQ